MKKITEIDPIRKEFDRFYFCILLHGKIPKSVKVWSEEHQRYSDEIHYVCEEGCNVND